MAEEKSLASVTEANSLCNFCRPRILDFSKLGWKEKTDSNGHIFLEPETTALPDGKIELTSWKNEDAFGPVEDITKCPFEDKHLGLRPFNPTFGINITKTEIDIEYIRSSTSVEEFVLGTSTKPTCRFCEFLLKWKEIYTADRGPRVLYFWQLRFNFVSCHPKGVEGNHEDSGPALMLSSLSIQFQDPIEMRNDYVISRSYTFSIVSDPRTCTANELGIKIHPLVPDLLDPINIADVKSWVEYCETADNHTSCREVTHPSSGPARFLELSTEDGTFAVRVIDSSTVGTTRYAALSHCWGTRGQNKPLKLLSSNKSEFMQLIPWDALPPVFRLAITFARNLGMRYMWIDSLCIIQDELKDWQIEAAKMSYVYNNAFLTIATTAASSPYDEIRFRQPEQEWHEVPWKFSSNNDLKGIYYFDVKEKKIIRDDVAQENTRKENDINKSEWGGRAWTLQESILSKRIIYVGKSALYWECLCAKIHQRLRPRSPEWNEYRRADWSSISLEQQFRSRLFNKGALDRPLQMRTLYDAWYRIIELDYANRRLSFPSDTIVALAGIAKETERILGKADMGNDDDIYGGGDNMYMGGLWKSDLVRGLSWYRSAYTYSREHKKGLFTRQNFLPKRDQLGEPNNCSSWLWTSIPLKSNDTEDGVEPEKHMWPYIGIGSDFREAKFEVNDVSLLGSSEGIDPYTNSTFKGALNLTGCMAKIPFKSHPPMTLEGAQDHGQAFDIEFCVRVGRESTDGYSYDNFHVNWTKEDFDLHARNELEIWGIMTAKGEGVGPMTCLILLLRNGEWEGKEIWRRIGFATLQLTMIEHYDDVPSVFEGAELRSIVVVV